MKRKIVKLLCLIMSVFMLFGMCACAGGGGGSDLIIAHKQEPAEAILTRKLINAFTAKKKAQGQEVEIKTFEISTGSYKSDITKQNASKTMADIYHSDDQLAPTWAKLGVFENLDPYFARSNFDFTLYDDKAFDAAKVYNGNIYYAPRTYDQPVVIVNVDFFDYYGVEVPTEDGWNWTKLVQTCDTLRKAIDAKENINEREVLFPMDCCLSWQPIYSTFVKAFGGYIIDGENKTFGLNQPEAIAAFTKIKELIVNKYFNRPSGAGYFTNGKSGMYIMSRAAVANLEANGTTNVKFLPYPVFDAEYLGASQDKGIMPYGASGYAMTASSKNKDLAWEFILFTLSEEAQNIMGANGTSVPVIKSLQTSADAAWRTQIEIIKDVNQDAFIFPDAFASKYERVLGNFGKGIAPEKEDTLYTNLKQLINAIDSAAYLNESVEVFCNDMQRDLATVMGSF